MTCKEARPTSAAASVTVTHASDGNLSIPPDESRSKSIVRRPSKLRIESVWYRSECVKGIFLTRSA